MADEFVAQGIDLSQLDLVEEGSVDAINPDADFSDSPPPVPDLEKGDAWVAKPKLINFKDLDAPLKTQKDPNNPNAVHLMLQVGWVLCDPRLEGTIWEDNELRAWPSTRPGFSGTSEVDTLLKIYTGKAGVGMSRKEKIHTLLPFLQAETPIGVVTEWRAEIEDTRANARPDSTQVIKRGMRTFPKVEGSEQYKHIFTDPRYPEAEVRTRAVVKAYKSL